MENNNKMIDNGNNHIDIDEYFSDIWVLRETVYKTKVRLLELRNNFHTSIKSHDFDPIDTEFHVEEIEKSCCFKCSVPKSARI